MLGQEQLHFAQLAVSQDNAANKTKISIVQGDTQLNPAQATTVTQQLTSDSKIVAVVGEDFPEEHRDLFRRRGVDLSGLETAVGKTFRWRGEYAVELGHAHTLETQLNVFSSFHPKLDDHHRASPFVFLANIDPDLQYSVLQQVNFDDSAGLIDWTYYSTLHFGESSAGTWTVSISDEQPLNTGSVQSVALTLDGVAITDTDHDGLDDDWEMAHFGSLASGPQDDPDGDGYSNAREQIMGTDPNAPDIAFQLDLSSWDRGLARLSWAGVTNRNYEVLSGTNAAAPLEPVTNLPGRFPDTEWFTPYTNLLNQFFRVRAVWP